MFERYIRPNLYLVLLNAVFIAGGVVFAHFYFPELSTLRATAGGIVFGVFCTMCVACHSVIWKS